MSESPVNFHRSFGALVAGNLIAIFLAGLTCILIGHATHPEYFEELRQFKSEQKQLLEDAAKAEAKKEKNPKEENPKEENPKEENPKEENPKEKNPKEKNPKEKNPKENEDESTAKQLARPEIPFGFLAITLVTDVVFAGIAGLACVLIAGFARNHHGMFMALFIVVWKVQQLLGFVENQVPATLLMIEVIALPIACMVGASLVPEKDSGEDAEENGPEQSE